MSDYTGGIKINLTEEDIKEAIEWGKENKDPLDIRHSHTFGDYLYMEWEDGGKIVTKYHALALLSASLARKGKSPSKAEIEEIVNTDVFGIEFIARLEEPIIFEDSRIFLRQHKKTIRPVKTKVVKEVTPIPNVSIFGERLATIYEGYIIAYFLYSQIDPKAETTIAFIMKGGWTSEFGVNFSWYE